jgi:glutamate-1-semialdehyde 2,1-aminomutase
MGSFCAHPLAMAAGIAFIEELEKGNYIQNSIDRAADLAKGINEITARLKMDVSAHAIYSIVHFGLNGKFDMSQVLEVFEFDLMIRLGLLLGNPGVVLLPGHVYMSGVMSGRDIQDSLPAFETAFKIYK